MRYLTILLALILPGISYGQTANAQTVIADTALIRLVEKAASKANEIDGAWPGFWRSAAFGVYRVGRYIVVYSPAAAPKGYQKLSIASVRPAVRNRLYYFAGAWPLLSGGVIPLLDTASPGSSAPDGIMIPEEFENEYVPVGVEYPAYVCLVCPTPLELLLHEAFHSWQRGHYKVKYLREGQFLDERTLDTAELVALRREREALERAIDNPGDATRIADYLSIREKRFKATPAVDIRRERFQESNEGVAEFVGILGDLLAEGSPSGLSQRIRSAVGVFWNVGDSDARRNMQNRTYASGAALAFLLETYDPQWREKVVAGVSLEEILAAAVAKTAL